MIKKMNKEEEVVRVVEVDTKKDTIHKKLMMIKVTMIKDVIQTKTDNMVTQQIKHLEVVKSTKLNTDLNYFY